VEKILMTMTTTLGNKIDTVNTDLSNKIQQVDKNVTELRAETKSAVNGFNSKIDSQDKVLCNHSETLTKHDEIIKELKKNMYGEEEVEETKKGNALIEVLRFFKRASTTKISLWLVFIALIVVGTVVGLKVI
jgi:hypothetical protein